MENGFGGVEPGRLAKSLDQIGLTYDFTKKPTPAAMFDSSYLPPAAERKL
jgi:NitT/TauT family transport system substrate-binding protein